MFGMKTITYWENVVLRREEANEKCYALVHQSTIRRTQSTSDDIDISASREKEHYVEMSHVARILHSAYYIRLF